MIKEYGSHFEWLPLSETEITSLDSTNCYLRTGRECLYVIGEKAWQQGARIVFMPSLCCASMAQPFIQLGFLVCYYPLDEELRIDLPRLDAMLTDNAVLLVMHYHGRRSYDETALSAIVSSRNNIITVQDGTQHCFTEELYDSIADYRVASVRKWISVADGASLWAKQGELPIPVERTNEFTDVWTRAMLVKREYLRSGDAALKNEYLSLYSQGMTLLRTQPIDVQAMSSLSRRRLACTDIDAVRKVRRENYNTLYAMLAEVPELVRFCVPQDCPLCFPIVVEDRDRVQKELAAQDIYCQVLWPLPDGAETCGNSVWFSQHMLAIPCDQRYTKEDMQCIAQHILNVL